MFQRAVEASSRIIWSEEVSRPCDHDAIWVEIAGGDLVDRARNVAWMRQARESMTISEVRDFTASGWHAEWAVRTAWDEAFLGLKIPDKCAFTSGRGHEQGGGISLKKGDTMGKLGVEQPSLRGDATSSGWPAMDHAANLPSLRRIQIQMVGSGRLAAD
jgi:hypothetical protein